VIASTLQYLRQEPQLTDALHPKPAVIDFLNDLRDDEVDAFRALVKLSPETIAALPEILRVASEEGNIEDGIRNIKDALITAKRINAMKGILRSVFIAAASAIAAVVALGEDIRKIPGMISKAFGGGP
jgi:hypothetical protein